MVLTVDETRPQVYIAPKNKFFPEVRVSNKKVNKDNSKKIIAGLIGLGIIGLASIAVSKYTPIYNQKQIKKLNETGQALADYAVKSSNKRNHKTVEIYNRHIKQKKLEVLKYKLSHGMFEGKSEEAMEHIMNNLKKLEGKY